MTAPEASACVRIRSALQFSAVALKNFSATFGDKAFSCEAGVCSNGFVEEDYSWAATFIEGGDEVMLAFVFEQDVGTRLDCASLGARELRDGQGVRCEFEHGPLGGLIANISNCEVPSLEVFSSSFERELAKRSSQSFSGDPPTCLEPKGQPVRCTQAP